VVINGQVHGVPADPSVAVPGSITRDAVADAFETAISMPVLTLSGRALPVSRVLTEGWTKLRNHSFPDRGRVNNLLRHHT
jgi:hypothetical protein